MKKITYSVFLLVCAIGFSQQPMVNTLGENNPVRFDKQQKSAVHSNGILDNSSKSILLLGDNNPVTHQRSAVTLPVNQQDIQAEIAADLLYRSENPEVISSVVRNANRPMDDIIPTAGATESFTPNVGDHFFDPGGPGGSNSDGDAGNYPNCNCDTQTTLLGVTEIEFIDFMVFATFDYLRIYDGTDATGTLIYDNGDGGMNEDDQNLNDMIASNGSATFTSTSGNFFFFFHASSVVNRLGWDVEIIAAGGGGGGTFPDPYCGPVDFSSTIEPITKVTFAGIENSSSDSTSSPAHEDFTDVEGNVEQGESYDIALEGNTNGSWTNNFTVFIDWNQNGSMDDAGERYEAGTINSSTGLDGQQAITNIAVPADAALGSTRMRVIKNFGASSYAPDSCTGSSWGQAEDYTIVISAGGGGGGGDTCSEENPNDGTFENGFNVSSASAFKTANDITVAAGENFTLTNITASIFANGGITNVDVVYYDDMGGLPGTEIGSETAVTIDAQNVIGENFGFDVNEIELSVTSFTFEGQEGSDTTYWIELSVTDGGATGSVFWVVTSSTSVGHDAAQYDAGWTINTDGMDGVYIWDGDCEPIDNGGGGDTCSEENPNDGTFENGFNVSSTSAFKTANDITVAAGENFTLTNITASIFANGGITNVDVVYYDDMGGLPGTEIGSETAVTIDSQNVIGSNFGLDVNEIELSVTPFVFSGQAGSETTYWIELSVTDGGATGSVFWVVTSSTSVGHNAAQYDAGWTINADGMDGVYIWEGDCNPLDNGGGGDTCSEENPNDGTFENGFNVSSTSAFKTANDLTVAAGENFTLTNITADRKSVV